MKPLATSKTRLSPAVPVGKRALLSIGMFIRVLEAARAAPDIDGVVVYGGDDAVRRASSALDAEWRPDPGRGLNGCVSAGFADAAAEGLGAALFLPADLPLLTPDDLARVIDAFAGASRPVFAPDRFDNGTNAILVPAGTRFTPALGKGSFMRHVEQANRLAISPETVRSEGLGLDIDMPADLDFLLDRCPDLLAELERSATGVGIVPGDVRMPDASCEESAV